MKKLKNIGTCIAFVILFSFSANGQELSHKEKELVKTELRNGMASFVGNLQSNFRKGVSYEDFRITLVGNGDMTKEGNALLKKAYMYLSEGTTVKEIAKNGSITELASAVIFINNYDKKNKSSNGEFVLFGNPTENAFPTNNLAEFNSARKCRWYQIRCQVLFVFDQVFNNGYIAWLLNL